MDAHPTFHGVRIYEGRKWREDVYSLVEKVEELSRGKEDLTQVSSG